jgi:membrane associated rhomboid family serine protease
MFNLLRNLPPATKNLLIINLIFFIGMIVFQSRDIFITNFLALRYFAHPDFSPIQIFTHMFMHGSFSHILFNMFGLVMFGSTLERFINTKKFLILYLASGFGAMFLQQAYEAFMIWNVTGTIFPDVPQLIAAGEQTIRHYNTAMVGASGCIYGLLVGFAMLFPNAELIFLFIPYPIKAKFMVPAIILLDLVLGITNFSGDPIAHFAHIGGALVGFILIKYWNKTNRDTLY